MLNKDINTINRQLRDMVRRLPVRPLAIMAVIVVFGVIGTALLKGSHATTPAASSEVEMGTLGSCAASVSDTTASGGRAVRFNDCSSGSTGNPSAMAGAQLPISYNLSSLTGTVVYVATTGSDSNNGSISSPYATLSKAISAAPSGGMIVLRGGTYHQGGLSVGKALTIIAYPGETPVFDGSLAASGGWTASGSLSYHSYTPMPISDGDGVTFSTGQGLTGDDVGKYPDAVWVNGNELEQVTAQSEVTAGKFWVDSANARVYLETTDVNQGNVAVSNLRTFANVSAAHVTFRGFKIIRYSNTGSDSGVININGAADNFLAQDMYEADSALVAVAIAPSGSDLNSNSTIKDSTITHSNWMGITALATNSLTIDHDILGNMNPWGEFNSSPKSGSMKTSRTWYTTLTNSQINGNKSHGVWFDQSNYDVTAAGNDIENNTGTGLFFEISDYLYAVNNYFKGNGRNNIEISGSTDAYVVNNTLVGAADQLGVYTDSRSIAGCSDPGQPACANSPGSDRDTYHTHQPTLTWLTDINMVVNNIFAYPTGTGYCSTNAGLCITTKNANATRPINAIIHQADSAHNVPQTLIDGNVYANGSTNIIVVNGYGTYTNVSAFTAALAGSPVNISGLEAHGLNGNGYLNSDGSPTSSLMGKETSAPAVPVNSTINTYVPAGTKHFGVLWK